MKYFKFIICILFALIFINAGLANFFRNTPMSTMINDQMKDHGAFEKIVWLTPLVGMIEMIGGKLFVFPKTRALGAIIIFPVIIGILFYDIYRDASLMNIGMTVVLLLINLWVIFDNKEKYKALVS